MPRRAAAACPKARAVAIAPPWATEDDVPEPTPPRAQKAPGERPARRPSCEFVGRGRDLFIQMKLHASALNVFCSPRRKPPVGNHVLFPEPLCGT